MIPPNNSNNLNKLLLVIVLYLHPKSVSFAIRLIISLFSSQSSSEAILLLNMEIYNIINPCSESISQTWCFFTASVISTANCALFYIRTTAINFLAVIEAKKTNFLVNLKLQAFYILYIFVQFCVCKNILHFRSFEWKDHDLNTCNVS